MGWGETVRNAEDLVKKAMKGNDASHDAAMESQVELAALLHDIDPSEEGIVENFLEEEGIEEEKKTKILGIIKGMDKHAGRANGETSPEFGVVQDADHLDAIGAIGIGRCFTFGESRNRVLHGP